MVPPTLLWWYSSGRLMDGTMSARAARWNTQSTPSNSGWMNGRSATSPSTTRSRAWLSRCARLAGRPVEKLSITATSWPRSSSAVTRWLPMKPAPPVTRLRMAQAVGEDVAKHQVHVLHRAVGADGRAHQHRLIHHGRQITAIEAGEGHRPAAAGLGQLHRAQDVGRVAAGRNGQQDVVGEQA